MKNILRFILSIIVVSMPAISVSADDYIDIVKKGNTAYSEKEYSTALDLYHSAEPELPESAELEYNLANALYQQENYDEAIERYTKALNTTDLDLQAQSHYNLGNTYFRKGDFQNAITSYQNTLTIDPEDIDAKFNMELARKMLKEQIKPEQQEQDQQQENQDQQQEQQQKQEGEDNKEGEEEQQEQQKQDSGGEGDEEKKEEQQKQQQGQPQKMSKEDAERILNALKDAEEKIQATVKRRDQTESNYNGNDW